MVSTGFMQVLNYIVQPQYANEIFDLKLAEDTEICRFSNDTYEFVASMNIRNQKASTFLLVVLIAILFVWELANQTAEQSWYSDDKSVKSDFVLNKLNWYD